MLFCLKTVLKKVLSIFFRFEVKGIENYYRVGKKAVIVANHPSFIDVVLLYIALPDKLFFTYNRLAEDPSLLKKYLGGELEMLEISTVNSRTITDLKDKLKDKFKLVIFPEARVSETGAPMKIYEDFYKLIKTLECPVLPVKISGVEYSFFSPAKQRVRRKLFPKIVVEIMPPRVLFDEGEKNGKEGNYNYQKDYQTSYQTAYQTRMHDFVSNLMLESSGYNVTIFEKLIEQQKVFGRSHVVAEDVLKEKLSFGSLLYKSLALGSKLSKFTREKEMVGLLLPNSCSMLVAFISLQSIARVPVMVNHTFGLSDILLSLHIANVKSILTSKAFVKNAQLDTIVGKLEGAGYRFYYLENIAQTFSSFDKAFAFVSSYFPERIYRQLFSHVKSDSPAVVIFSSGSEGCPKGVVLSHSNILSNIAQVVSRIDILPSDTLFCCLPLFHSFGLSCSMLLPVFSGLKVFFYPTPKNYQTIPEMLYLTKSTIFFSTDTFLSRYAKYANSYDFLLLRYLIVGAEKLKESTRDLYMDKFGINIIEGYGVTEASPVISVNSHIFYKKNSVGRVLPGIRWSVEPVEDFDNIGNSGRLIVSGPNVMKGYLDDKKPGEILALKHCQHDTGDIVEVDEQGFLFIKGRVRRFAKIAGKMVSLVNVEEFISKLWGEYEHMVVSKEDEKKGECLVLLTTNPSASIEEIIEYAKNNGISQTSIPKDIRIVEELPLLGSGKKNYVSAAKLLL